MPTWVKLEASKERYQVTLTWQNNGGASDKETAHPQEAPAFAFVFATTI